MDGGSLRAFRLPPFYMRHCKTDILPDSGKMEAPVL